MAEFEIIGWQAKFEAVRKANETLEFRILALQGVSDGKARLTTALRDAAISIETGLFRGSAEAYAKSLRDLADQFTSQ
jgi:hypothetical protein